MNFIKASMASAAISGAALGQLQPGMPYRYTLDNGLTVILQPVDGLSWIGMNTMCRAGFMQDPDGLPQAAHLVEHLRCYAATANYPAGIGFQTLNRVGMGNAETLPTVAHYDAALPANALEEAIKIEAERLAGLAPDAALVAQEAPRCYAEVAAVESSETRPVLKFAFMAANQRWRYGREDVMLKGGLAEAGVEPYRRFLDRYYRPDNMVVSIVGGFDRDEALTLVRTHFGAIPNPDPSPVLAPIDWASLPAEMSVAWDVDAPVVILAYPPPADATDAGIISLWSRMLGVALAGDQDVRRVTRLVATTEILWTAGELPVFVYASLKPDVTIEDAIATLTARVDLMTAEGRVEGELNQVRANASQMTTDEALLRGRVRRDARRVMERFKLGEDPATGMVLGTEAMQHNFRQMLYGRHGPAIVAALAAANPERLTEIVRGAYSPAKRRVTILRPKASPEPAPKSATQAGEPPTPESPR